MPAISQKLSRLPLIVRCTLVGAGCVAAIAVVLTVINVIGEYSAEDVIQAMLFGMIEASVVGGVAGCALGLVAGVLAYLTRSAMRGVMHRRS